MGSLTKIVKGKQANYIGIFWLVVFSVFIMISEPKVSAVDFNDSYNKMNNRLPDDEYTLYKNGSPVGSSTDCAAKWGCTTDNYSYFNNGSESTDSHQYITLAKDSINDDGSVPSSAKYKYANTTELEVYTYGAPTSSRELRINVVNRGIGDSLACYNWITAYYYTGDAALEARTPDALKTNGCVRTYSFANIPVGAFKEIRQNNQATNIYRAKVLLSFGNLGDKSVNPSNSQISFHVSTSFGRIGYMGATSPKLLATPASEHAWVNQYPTNYGREHKIRFYFRPPCSVGNASFDLEWDDVNTGDPNFQPNPGSAKLYRYRPGDIGSRQIVRTYSSLGSGYQSRTETTENYATNQPYAYMMEFEGIYGGNGISFSHPFDSADARIECPPPPPTGSGNANCNNISFTVPSGGNGTRAYKIYFRNRSAASGAVGEGGMLASGTLLNNPYSTTASGSTVNFNVDDRYVSGYFEYMIRVYQGADGTTGLDSGFDGDGIKYGDVGGCYMADCTVSAWDSILGAGKARAGQSFNVNISIRNIGINDITSPRVIGGAGYRLAGTLALDGKWTPPDGDSSGGLAPKYMNDLAFGSLGVGGVAEETFTQTAPAGQGTHNVTMYPDYWGRGGIGGVCNSTVTTYERYDFTATAASALLPDNESPTTAQFSPTLRQDTPIGALGIATRSFYKERPGIPKAALPGFGPFSETAEFGSRLSPVYDATYGIPAGSYQRGDSYCVEVSLDRGHGWRSGNDYVNEGPAEASNCKDKGGSPPEVADYPYIRTYGADVVAGGGFNGTGANSTCGATASGIFAFMRPLNEQTDPAAGGSNRSGSGAQLAAMALGDISGFTSASLRTTPPSSTAGNGLTFAHGSSAPNQTSMDALLGGGMSAGNGWCAADFYTETQFSLDAKKPDGTARVNVVNDNSQINIGTLDDQEQTIKNPPSNSIKINAPATFSGHHTIYVDGDVFIDDNITYIPSYASIQQIPSFALIVRGNIYIDSDVSRLDGLYVAQPYDRNSNGSITDSGDGKGRIYTCAKNFGSGPVTSASELFNDCGAAGGKPRLTVNGALIAQRVVFNRTMNSLRDSRYQEGPYMPNASSAAEIINFSAEMFLSPPVFRAKGTATSGDYDYITTLPPIL